MRAWESLTLDLWDGGLSGAGSRWRRALEESELRFQQAVTGGKVGIWRWNDMESDELWWSPMFYALLGYQPHELEASLDVFKKLLHPADIDQTFAAVEDCRRGGRPFAIDYRLKTKDQGYRWFYAAGTIDVDEMTGQTRMMGSIQDIQWRKDAEEQIVAANKELAVRNKEMEEMAYAVSHDLKSPLVSIQGFVTLLLQERYGIDEDTRGMLLRIEKAASHMGDLISDLLEVSKIGRSEETLESVDTGKVANEVVDAFGVQAQSSGCELVVRDPMPTLRASRKRMRQLLQNLVSNALKYGSNAANPRIEIGCDRSAEWVDIYVQDNGAGIQKECLEAVFKLFKRLNHNAEGTGLGLAIVAKVMSTYGGSAFAESEPGTGARFVLRFPAEMARETGEAAEYQNP